MRVRIKTRLISPGREVEELLPGNYTLRAEWILFGCTEEPDGTDCLTPLQNVSQPGTPAKVDFQEPVEVISNEVSAESPTLLDLGTMKFAFDVNLLPTGVPPQLAASLPSRCADEKVRSIDCTVFHYRIENNGTRAVRRMRFSCSDSSIVPEYWVEGQWRPVPPKQWPWICTMNILVETPILPGKMVEGDFTLATLVPGYDTRLFRVHGDWRVRFTLQPDACFASPDGRFCLTTPETQPSVASHEIIFRTQ
jgi:hypothetical protein